MYSKLQVCKRFGIQKKILYKKVKGTKEGFTILL
jgi:hypothetical protein